MEIHKTEPTKLIRVYIKRHGELVERFTLVDTTKEQAMEEFMQALKEKASIFAKGNAASVTLRDAVGSKNGKQVTFKLFGMKAKEINEVLRDYVNTTYGTNTGS